MLRVGTLCLEVNEETETQLINRSGFAASDETKNEN